MIVPMPPPMPIIVVPAAPIPVQNLPVQIMLDMVVLDMYETVTAAAEIKVDPAPRPTNGGDELTFGGVAAAAVIVTLLIVFFIKCGVRGL